MDRAWVSERVRGRRGGGIGKEEKKTERYTQQASGDGTWEKYDHTKTTHIHLSENSYLPLTSSVRYTLLLRRRRRRRHRHRCLSVSLWSCKNSRQAAEFMTRFSYSSFSYFELLFLPATDSHFGLLHSLIQHCCFPADSLSTTRIRLSLILHCILFRSICFFVPATQSKKNYCILSSVSFEAISLIQYLASRHGCVSAHVSCLPFAPFGQCFSSLCFRAASIRASVSKVHSRRSLRWSLPHIMCADK